jgi:hypothetical protein
MNQDKFGFRLERRCIAVSALQVQARILLKTKTRCAEGMFSRSIQSPGASPYAVAWAVIGVEAEALANGRRAIINVP